MATVPPKHAGLADMLLGIGTDETSKAISKNWFLVGRNREREKWLESLKSLEDSTLAVFSNLRFY